MSPALLEGGKKKSQAKENNYATQRSGADRSRPESFLGGVFLWIREIREFREFREIKEFWEVGVLSLISLTSLTSLNSLISLISLPTHTTRRQAPPHTAPSRKEIGGVLDKK